MNNLPRFIILHSIRLLNKTIRYANGCEMGRSMKENKRGPLMKRVDPLWYSCKYREEARVNMEAPKTLSLSHSLCDWFPKKVDKKTHRPLSSSLSVSPADMAVSVANCCFSVVNASVKLQSSSVSSPWCFVAASLTPRASNLKRKSSRSDSSPKLNPEVP